MRHPTLRPTLATALLLVLGACSTAAPRAPGGAQGQARRAAPVVPTAAFARRDVPYEQVVADARSSGRNAVLFFWTSW